MVFHLALAFNLAGAFNFDWELMLFKGLRALWRKVLGSPPGPVWAEGAVPLASLQASLSVLAQLEAGGPVRVLPAPDAGDQGWEGAGVLLRLPSLLSLASEPEVNRELYLLRTLVSIRMLRLQREIASAQTSSSAGQCTETGTKPGLNGPLETLRLAALAAEALSQEYPHFGPAWEAARALELSHRPRPEGLTGAARRLELARQAALRGEQPWLEPLQAGESALPTGDSRPGKSSSPGVLLWGELLPAVSAVSMLAEHSEDSGPPPAGTERPAPPPARVSRVHLDPKEQADAVLQHTFEKVETADAWRGGARDTDGSDSLDEQLEALQEVELGEVMRGGEPAQSLFHADILLDSQIPEVGRVLPGEEGLPFDEWDEQRRVYRPGWCTVYPTPLPPGDPSWALGALRRYRSEINRLQRTLEAHRQRWRRMDRQPDGPEIDLSALVDELADRQAGAGGDLRLFTRDARRVRDVATTVLIDVSLSTDAWVADRRVLDVARESVLVLGEVADVLGDALEVLAFASQTRNQCRVFQVRRFDEAWSVGRTRLGGLKPQGYTRIGPALRYAIRGLAQRSAQHRLLLLISDGKPTDYDRYEGRYGIQDIRQALREAEALGISCHALAVDRTARQTLPMMFGPHGWDILLHPERLPELLTTVYGRLTGGG